MILERLIIKFVTRAMKTKKQITFENYYAPWDRWFDNRVVPTKEGSCFLSGHNRTQISRKKAEILNTELKIRKRTI
jgi:hypothetical protein